MGLQATPRGERLQIAFFGKRNAGKSSLINAITGQESAIVSSVKGTTTDPVYKAMELLPLGPVTFVDTPGLDDEGVLGEKRMEKTREVLNKTDIAVVVFDLSDAVRTAQAKDASLPHPFARERDLIKQIREKGVPYLAVWNKYDVWQRELDAHPEYASLDRTFLEDDSHLYVSAKTGYHIHELKERIANQFPNESVLRIIGDMLEPNDVVILVVPIDESAPKGRLILPQQQTIRDVLESGAIAMVTRDSELENTLRSIRGKPRMVVTDSQAFSQASSVTPPDVPLTSFSILFARYKGELESLVNGVRALERLKDGDLVLMAEGCTHHRQCNDIGTVKIPRWLKEKTGKELVFETSSGGGYPKDINKYSLIVHCGACMLTQREMRHRIERTKEHNVPIINYGVLIAYLKGILKRSLEPFPEAIEYLESTND